MIFKVSEEGVKNTKGTKAKFGANGKVLIRGNFQNTGDVEVDTNANLEILGDLINSGSFNVKDYLGQERYVLIEKAINALDGQAKLYLQSSYGYLKRGEIEKANSYFGRFVSYLKRHPGVVVGAVQVLLQAISMMK